MIQELMKHLAEASLISFMSLWLLAAGLGAQRLFEPKTLGSKLFPFVLAAAIGSSFSVLNAVIVTAIILRATPPV